MAGNARKRSPRLGQVLPFRNHTPVRSLAAPANLSGFSQRHRPLGIFNCALEKPPDVLLAQHTINIWFKANKLSVTTTRIKFEVDLQFGSAFHKI